MSSVWAQLREWDYIPGSDYIIDHSDLFAEDFEWGAGDNDDEHFDRAWPTIGKRPHVFCLDFQNDRFDRDSLENEGLILFRQRWPEAGENGACLGELYHAQALFAVDPRDPDDWMRVALQYGAKRIEV